MEHGKVILQKLQDRLNLLTELKKLMLQQQRALVSTNTEQIDHFSEMQVDCMSKLQEVESQWQELIRSAAKTHNVQTNSTEQIIQLILDDSNLNLALGYLEKIKQLVSQIETVKQNNTLLIHNSLALVRSTLNHLQRGQKSDAVYHPKRKQAMSNVLFNQKL